MPLTLIFLPFLKGMRPTQMIASLAMAMVHHFYNRYRSTFSILKNPEAIFKVPFQLTPNVYPNMVIKWAIKIDGEFFTLIFHNKNVSSLLFKKKRNKPVSIVYAKYG